MISCKLQGGLGNQLFQIAATHALALRNNDTSCFDIGGCYTPLQGHTASKYANNILSNVLNVSGHRFSSIYHEPRFGYQPIPYAPNRHLIGYFQSEKYFEDYKREIKNLFKITQVDAAKEILEPYTGKGKLITSVHIRRGDYLNNPAYHPTSSFEYYKEAMELIGDSIFIFISDDIDWVKANFIGENYTYSTASDELTDLAIMTLCDHNIIANSSFSWWGAYLNPNKGKIVIAPKEWFGPNGHKDTEDVTPDNWLRL
jgi:hypothetical protein